MTRIQCRIGVPINRQTSPAGSGSSGPPPVSNPEGDNYRFTFDGDFYQFNIRSEAGNAYEFDVLDTGDIPGTEYYRLATTPNPSPAVVGIIPNFATGQSYQFTTNNYMRFLNRTLGAYWHTVSANLDESPLISDRFASMALNSTDANTFNAIFISGSFFFRYIPTGQRFKPWVVIDGGGTSLRLTAI